MAKRRTIPGTNIPIGRKKSGGGLTQKQKEQANKQIQQNLPPPPPKPVPQPPGKNLPRLGSKARPRIYGTGDKLDYVPFNIDNRPRNKNVLRIFNEMGYISWRDIFIDPRDIAQLSGNASKGYRRGHVYLTPNELVARYADTGAWRSGLVRIYYDPNIGAYFAYVFDSI